MLIPAAAKIELRQAVSRAASSRERGEILRAYAATWRVSDSTARRDARDPVVARTPKAPPAADPLLDQMVDLWLDSASEKYPAATMPVADLIDMCEVAGVSAPGQVTPARFKRYAAAHRISLKDQRGGRPYTPMQSLHPNQVQMTDVSRSRQYYLRDDGRLDVQSYQRGTAEYRNKDLRGAPLFRYVLVDHFSGEFWVQYYTDETAATLLTFLASAWLPKRGTVMTGPTGVTRRWLVPFTPDTWDEWKTFDEFRDYPFRGVPKILIADRASQNQSEFTRELCRRLGVELKIAQEARAKGTVEGLMWIFERKFETRLRHQPATDLATLNLYAADFVEYYCRKFVHSRHGMTRTQKWSTIAREQLVELDDWPRFADAARREPRPAKVTSGEAGSGWIRYGGRVWRMETADYITETVLVSEAALRPDELIAQTGDGRTFVLQPVRFNEHGFSERAKAYGEAFASHPMTATEKTRARAAEASAALPPLIVFGREGEKKDAPNILGPRRGVEISLESVGVREINMAQFDARVLAKWRKPYTEAMGARRDEIFAGSKTVPESTVDEFLTWAYAQQAEPSRKVVNLFG